MVQIRLTHLGVRFVWRRVKDWGGVGHFSRR